MQVECDEMNMAYLFTLPSLLLLEEGGGLLCIASQNLYHQLSLTKLKSACDGTLITNVL